MFCGSVPAVALSPVLLTKALRQKSSGRHGTAGPGVIDTLSHYLMTALAERERERVQRSDTEVAGHTHTHEHMGLHVYVH